MCFTISLSPTTSIRNHLIGTEITEEIRPSGLSTTRALLFWFGRRGKVYFVLIISQRCLVLLNHCDRLFSVPLKFPPLPPFPQHSSALQHNHYDRKFCSSTVKTTTLSALFLCALTLWILFTVGNVLCVKAPGLDYSHNPKGMGGRCIVGQGLLARIKY